ncbi:putative phosphatase; putative signal peptide [Bradyrhizobium sp. ORS 278]|uniref:substrate-binding domain-containing protein n=1 Tax=Bradyrhizobium sp. (strain ORS 278) TaxID=114615 RepID=UPI0001507CB9|nr:substrate-binding domain-containing protein [Bradyrhizobium sp. ORS 278]CAL76056.1 putative phosphatase; putative signal peptide [Bradyrhizobium sp. ORS 278]
MRNLNAIIMGSAAFACAAVASNSAHAGSYAFGAGATFPSIAYRQLMDCLYNQVQGSAGLPGPLAKATACTGFNGSGFGGGILYAPTGSGNGKLVLRTNDKASITTPSSSNTVPYTDSTIGVNTISDYDGVQFAGSDDVATASDIAAWNAAGNPAKFGNMITIPALVGPVAIGFNGKDGAGAALNILPATPAGGSSGLNLSRNALCGIVSGHITKWNNPILTALNGGVLGTGNITFVHRTDGSGTTFLFSNALATQCQFEIGPNNETDTTTVSYALPWTDRSGACPRPVARGANQLNWPDQFTTDQCGTVISNPGGGTFAGGSGSSGVVSAVTSTNGAMGYASADFWLPVKTNGLKTANLQAQWDITNNTGKFQPPTPAGASNAMASAVPQFSAATRTNPLAWSLQGVVPNPVLPDSYPISGFTWIHMYQCYANHANGNNGFIWFRTWLDYLYGSNNAKDILEANGFAKVPSAWLIETYTLLSDPAVGPAQTGNGGCATIAGAY